MKNIFHERGGFFYKAMPRREIQNRVYSFLASGPSQRERSQKTIHPFLNSPRPGADKKKDPLFRESL